MMGADSHLKPLVWTSCHQLQIAEVQLIQDQAQIFDVQRNDLLMTHSKMQFPVSGIHTVAWRQKMGARNNIFP